MKINFTAKVIIFTVVCFAISFTLARTAGEQVFQDYSQKVISTYSHSEEATKRRTQETFKTTGLDEVQLNATSADLKIETSPDADIHLLYTKKSEAELLKSIKKKNAQLGRVQGAVLKFELDDFVTEENDVQIHFGEDKENFGLMINNTKVVLQIPSEITNLVVQTVSGESKVVGLNLASLKIESVSGDAKVENCTLESVVHESISGNLKLLSAVKKLKIKTVSGDVKFQSELAAPEAKILTTSGDVKVSFTRSPDVSVKFVTTSGEIKIQTESGKTRVQGSVDNFKLGQGSAAFEIETTSGDVRIL